MPTNLGVNSGREYIGGPEALEKQCWKLAEKIRDRCKGVFTEGVLGTKCRKLAALVALSHFCLRFGFLSRNLLHIRGRKVSQSVAKLSQSCYKVVAKLLQSRHKVVAKCRKVVAKLSQSVAKSSQTDLSAKNIEKIIILGKQLYVNAVKLLTGPCLGFFRG